jgi:hypothetical protein
MSQTIIIFSFVHANLENRYNSGGYGDIYLQRCNNLYPGIKNDWVLVLKYIKQADAENSKLIAERKRNP